MDATERQFFGHPKGLQTLFFTEMWERFSYYGMRAFLVLFMTTPVAAGGLGFDATRAGIIYGLYTAMVYLLSVPGGWIADRFIGQQRAVLFGGAGIMAGHICLAVPAGPTFYLGLALVALGTGLLKPNISTIVGQLYGEGDKRRDAGFSIFYMGINIGAFFAPLFCGSYLAESESFRNTLSSIGIEPRNAWHIAFSAAAVGMGAGLTQYFFGLRYLGDAGKHPTPPKDDKEAATNQLILVAVIAVFLGVPILVGGLAAGGVITLTPEGIGQIFDIVLPGTAIAVFAVLFLFGVRSVAERNRLIVIALLFLAAAVFWACFEQAGSTLTLFARDFTDRNIFGWKVGASLFQSFNALFVVMLAPLFAVLWLRMANANKEPTTLVKFGFGMVLVGLGFLVMVPAAQTVMGGSKVGPQWLITLYLVHTCGELCLSPVGLSSMTKLAPARWGGLVMGIWFLASSLGNYMSGRAVGLTETMDKDNFFLLMTGFPVAIGLILWVVAKPVQKMLDASPAPKSGGGH